MATVYRFADHFSEARIGRFLLAAVIVICALGIPIAIVAFVGMSNSEKVEQAKLFLTSDEQFKSEVGEIEDVGFFVSDKIALGKKSSYMKLRIDGSKRSASVLVFFKKDMDGKWVVDRYEFR